ncbi:MAG TPA: RsmD family RNA methyltransferase [Rhizomicrobium sp.]|nr:RsmD family RNA methyltransferase [Rhizomicrobium sp.]
MTASCRHFGQCGGCVYQNLSVAEYRARKRSCVVEALAKAGLVDASVAEIAEVGPGTRRRATIKAAKSAGAMRVGFHAAASHEIVDMHECLVLTPGLFALVPHLRDMMDALLGEGEKAELHVTEAENGADVAIRWKRSLTPALVGAAAQWGRRLKLSRLSANGEPLFMNQAPFVTIGSVRLPLQIESFLQATAEGETMLQTKVLTAAKGARSVLDLFAGVGTFTLPLAQRAKVHAVEADAAALAALAEAVRFGTRLKPVTTERRDLFRQPLTALELVGFDLVLLDPPRAGALSQARELAKSRVGRLIYVSCSAESFARDAQVLVAGGYRMGTVSPIDQFLWSSHIEVTATFTRA